MFGINYAPEPTGAGVVTTTIAQSLAAQGWGVDVITGIPHYPSWRPSSAPRLSVSNGVRVRRRSHYIPSTQSAVRRGAYEVSWLVSAARDALVSEPPDIVLGIVPSLSGGALAAAAAVRYRVPFALLFFDVMGRAAAQTGVPGASRVASAVSAAELALARRAAGVAVIADGFRGYLVNGGVRPDRVTHVRLPRTDRGPDSRPSLGGEMRSTFGDRDGRRAETRKRLGWRHNEFVVLYSGSIGYKQALETVVEAARQIGGDHEVRFVIQGDGNRRRDLEQLAERLKLRNLEFRSLVESSELPAVLEAADALLLHQRGSVRNMSLASKLVAYFSSGTPVLLGMASDDEIAVAIRDAAAGIVISPEDPASLLDAISLLRREPARAREIAAAAAVYASQEFPDVDAATDVERFLGALVPAKVGLRVESRRRT